MASTRVSTQRQKKTSSGAWIVFIGIFKLLKGVLLLALGIGLLKLLHKDVAATADHWIRELRFDPDNRYIHRALLKVFAVTPKQLKELSAGTFVYSGLFLTEGTGLVLRKRWAEYMTLITTGLLIPFELYELFKHFTIVKLLLAIANVLIVWYLAMQVRRGRR
jgi:uncharacterized membrane protein (DUF2068 family)